jgi:DNA repair protein RadA/Sms
MTNLDPIFNDSDHEGIELPTDSTPHAAPKEKKSLYWRIQDLAHGRCRVSVERGALEHVDQLRLSSDLQREKFAAACDAKLPGCYDEVLTELERHATRHRSYYNPKTDDGCRFVFTSLDKIVPKPVDWLWQNYIPAGCVTILEGDPGAGKTLVLADLAARVSNGFLAPDRQPAFDEPGYDPAPSPELVWWFAGHDDLEETLAPRLRAAGANPSLVRIIEGTEDMKKQLCRKVSFPEDFDPLWKCKGAAPRLVIVDLLSAFCGGSLNHQRAVKALREFARFAEATGAAVVVVRPLNRRVGALASERGSAGAALAAEARSVLLLGSHPNDPQRQVLAAVKCNLCAKPPSQEWAIVESDGESPVPRVSWLGPSAVHADELVKTSRPTPAPSPFEQKKVEEWLGEKLKAGPKLAKEINEQAKLDDVPPILLRRAQISLGVVPAGSNGSTKWSLPGESSEEEGTQTGSRSEDRGSSGKETKLRDADDDSDVALVRPPHRRSEKSKRPAGGRTSVGEETKLAPTLVRPRKNARRRNSADARLEPAPRNRSARNARRTSKSVVHVAKGRSVNSPPSPVRRQKR